MKTQNSWLRSAAVVAAGLVVAVLDCQPGRLFEGKKEEGRGDAHRNVDADANADA